MLSAIAAAADAGWTDETTQAASPETVPDSGDQAGAAEAQANLREMFDDFNFQVSDQNILAGLIGDLWRDTIEQSRLAPDAPDSITLRLRMFSQMTFLVDLLEQRARHQEGQFEALFEAWMKAR